MNARLLLPAAAVALAAAGAAAGLYARSGDSSTEPARADRCRDWVAAREYRHEIAAVRPLVASMQRGLAAPGLSVAVAADGKLVWSQTCGFADLRRRRSVNRSTRFRIGSVSKAITAVAAARLQQRGLLDVDADVRTYVPHVPAERPRMTLRQLGGHLGGIRHYQSDEAVNTTHYASLADSLRVFINDPLVAPPGERFSYSSYGFNLLGAAVEAAAGKRFAQAVTAAVLAPLGMQATRVGGPPAGGTQFYEVTSARRAVAAPRIDLSDRYPSGGFLSTAEDLVRLGLGITDSTFLDSGSQALLFTSQRTRGGKATHYGFGFEGADTPLGQLVGHTGNVVGGTAAILIHPRTRVVVALATNIGFVTAPAPPSLRGVPDPPRLAMPFIRRALRGVTPRTATAGARARTRADRAAARRAR